MTMEVSVIGVSHRTASVEVRERFALPGGLAGRLLAALHAESAVEEALVLDTCNRTEVYFVSRWAAAGTGILLGHIARLKGLAGEPEASAFYRHDGEAAVEHLFRVAAALDSQIVGEHQILGQIKDAYRLALEHRTARFLLNRLLHRAFRVGKRVRTETELCRGSVSVAAAAVDLARQVFSDLAGKSALLVGAGGTAELAARRLIAAGAGRVIVANRTLARARRLAAELAEAPRPGKGPSCRQAAEDAEDAGEAQPRCPAMLRLPGGQAGGAGPPPAPPRPATEAVDLAGIPRALAEVELVICSTGSPEPVLAGAEVRDTIRRRRGYLFIIDLAVPRDVDPALGLLPNVFLNNLDDLDRVVARNIDRRRLEVPRAEAIVADELRQFLAWHDSLQVASTVRLLQRRFALLREAEVRRYGGQFADGDAARLDQFAAGLCSKVLHQPIAFLRAFSQEATTGDQLAAVEIIRRMFDLDALEDGT